MLAPLTPADRSDALQHLTAALSQTIPSDDQTIMNHVRRAYWLMGGRDLGLMLPPPARHQLVLQAAE